MKWARTLIIFLLTQAQAQTHNSSTKATSKVMDRPLDKDDDGGGGGSALVISARLKSNKKGRLESESESEKERLNSDNPVGHLQCNVA